ncbi:DNA-binding protein [Burkholderia lata]|uniref:DNA-binding protein n=2 Tax=Burkholderia lata (strain ATCC 17760 / DSM 23089 / LMG 22485 / NCIMB 9086 / R18194 / 383) TaxID=482957 RepID=A0A6P2I4B9_BURL3|nr:DNA-binding protein [Burkholderia lata]
MIRGMPNLSSHRQDPVLVALGQTIRRIRKERDMSQEQLALSADVDMSYLGRVERGDNNVAVLRLKRIADALGITMTALMTEAGL